MDYKKKIDENKEAEPLKAEESLASVAVENDVTLSAIDEMTPYTIEELDARLEQSEKDFEEGRYFSNEEVMSELTQFVNAL